jgi:hypothetical protein
MSSPVRVAPITAAGHAVSFHLNYPHLFSFDLGGRDVELWKHDDAVARFVRRGSFQLLDHNEGLYYNANRATLVVDEDLGFFAILDYNRAPSEAVDEVVWQVLKIFSLEDARFLRTIDLRGLLVSNNYVYRSGQLVGMLYELTADGAEIETSATRIVSIHLADSPGVERTGRTKDSPACLVLETSNDPDIRYPQPAVFMPNGDVVCVTGGWQDPEGRRLGLARWRQVDLANGRPPRDYLGLKLDCSPGADHSSNPAWSLHPGASLDSVDEWAAPLGGEALIVCIGTRWTADIVDSDFWASSRLQAFDVLADGPALRWSADIMRGKALGARYVPSLDAVVVLGEHDFAGHHEDGTIDQVGLGDSRGYGTTSWMALLDPRTGRTRKHQTFAHRVEALALAASGFSARADGGLDVVFVFKNGAICIVAAEDFAAHGFPRTDVGRLAVRSGFEIEQGWEIRGAAVGDGCAVVLVSNAEQGAESTASEVRYALW